MRQLDDEAELAMALTSAPISTPTAATDARTWAAPSALEAAAWADFGSPQAQDVFLGRWLALLCLQIEGVRSALLLVAGPEDNTFHAGAVWPDPDRDLAYLAPLAQQALAERRGVVVAAADAQSSRVAYPVEVEGELVAAIVLDALPRSDAGLQRALRQVHWGAAWLVDLYRQQALRARDAHIARLALVQSTVGAALQQRGFEAAAMAAVNVLATRLGCDRVSLGRDEDGEAVIEAISNTASFDRRNNLSRLIADAMDEALDAGVPVRFPAQGDARLGAASHAALAKVDADDGVADADDGVVDADDGVADAADGVADAADGAAALSVLLVDAEGSFGVLTFERRRGRPFDDEELETCTVAGLLLGPVLALAHANDRSLPGRVADKLLAGAQAVFGPRHPGVKLLTAAAAALLLAMAFVDGTYRVSARTVVEGEVQRATVVPFDGFLAESLVRAGDTVRRGQVMARLDDRELRLEADRWRAEYGQYLGKYRQAQAIHDRAATNVLGAQANQALAQLQLTEERLGRLQLVAPFDGLVVTGDLRQLVGTPLEQGKVLFETAPLDAYRVVLQVDERDIAHVARGQHGELVLAGLPGVPLAFTVRQVTPVATAEDGRNFFRVEAEVQGGTGRLRPGMEGVGKVEIGERRLLWIWTHGLVDWLRLAGWRWWP